MSPPDTTRLKVGAWKHLLAGGGLDKHALLVALSFGIYMDSEGYTFVSLSKLVEVTGMGKATVHKYTQQLVELGFIARTTEGRGKRSYTMATVPLWMLEVTKPTGSARVNHLTLSTGSISDETGSISEASGSPSVNPIPSNPEEEPRGSCEHLKRIRTGPSGAWIVCADCGHTSIEDKNTEGVAQ
jgi:biotin operon repressor